MIVYFPIAISSVCFCCALCSSNCFVLCIVKLVNGVWRESRVLINDVQGKFMWITSKKIFLASGWWVIRRVVLNPRISRVVVSFDVFSPLLQPEKLIFFYHRRCSLNISFVLCLFSLRVWRSTQHERVTQQMKLRKKDPNRMHSITSACRVAGCGAERPLFYLFNFSFQHWHIYIHFWPRFSCFEFELAQAGRHSKRGDLCALSK